MGSTVQQSQWVQQFNSHNEFNSSTVQNGFNNSTVTMGSTVQQSQWVQQLFLQLQYWQQVKPFNRHGNLVSNFALNL